MMMMAAPGIHFLILRPCSVVNSLVVIVAIQWEVVHVATLGQPLDAHGLCISPAAEQVHDILPLGATAVGLAAARRRSTSAHSCVIQVRMSLNMIRWCSRILINHADVGMIMTIGIASIQNCRSPQGSNSK